MCDKCPALFSGYRRRIPKDGYYGEPEQVVQTNGQHSTYRLFWQRSYLGLSGNFELFRHMTMRELDDAAMTCFLCRHLRDDQLYHLEEQLIAIPADTLFIIKPSMLTTGKEGEVTEMPALSRPCMPGQTGIDIYYTGFRNGIIRDSHQVCCGIFKLHAVPGSASICRYRRLPMDLLVILAYVVRNSDESARLTNYSRQCNVQ